MWLSGIPRIKLLKEWLCEMRSWAHQDPSFYKMISIISALNSSIVDEICVIQGSNGRFVFANGVDSAVMNLVISHNIGFSSCFHPPAASPAGSSPLRGRRHSPTWKQESIHVSIQLVAEALNQGILDFLTWHLRQRAAREAAIFAAMPFLKRSHGSLGPINLTCDGWYSPSEFDSDELPDLIDADM
ncbi:hypothetical protein B0H13DRAFT_1922229 [Mycena leptocephala]|nr:hypothetical protein B0H13DRAFT_1922229 [Mycena leptocephala]